MEMANKDGTAFVTIKLGAAEVKGLDALQARLPMTRTGLAREAIRRGLAELAADPSSIVRPAGGR